MTNHDTRPPLRRPEEMPPVRSQEGLCRQWQALMGDLGFSGYSLWLHLIEADGRPTPILTQIEGMSHLPDEDDDRLRNLMWLCSQLTDELAPGGRLAFLLSRPGRAEISEWDRAWAQALATSCRSHGVPIHPIHRANDETVAVIAPDELDELAVSA
ncbi:hypothetical protein [Nocardioides speluncae]|uniref:hypothetical protein n=1 Tax=Nocardioides speluncae TaxID=2670337 RepID=UPI0012B177C0|nr:hypothetical protein [Nocardioides speluncae]